MVFAFRTLIAIAALSCVAGCQSVRRAQFTTRLEYGDAIVASVSVIAQKLGMQDRHQEFVIPRTLAYFADGQGAYTGIGVRQHDADLVIDVLSRTYGGSHRQFNLAVSEVRTMLKQLAPDFVERTIPNLVPLDRNEPSEWVEEY